MEDEDFNADLVWRICRHFGADVVTVPNGLVPLEQLDKGEFNLVLCDLSMPRLDGWALIRHIRETKADKPIAVIALTAHAMEGDREHALEAGFSGYFIKPIDDAFGLLHYLIAVAGY